MIGCVQEHTFMHTCVTVCTYTHSHLHMCKTLKTECGKERQRYLYWGRLLAYIFCCSHLKKTRLFLYTAIAKKKMVHLSTNKLPFLLPKQLLQTIYSFASSLYRLTSHFPESKLELIHVRQKSKLKELRLWTPCDLPSNPSSVTSSCEIVAELHTLPELSLPFCKMEIKRLPTFLQL